jgi:hypothetical protein
VLLGWCNARIRLRARHAFDPATVIADFLWQLRRTPVAHVKLTTVEPTGGAAALVRRGGEVSLDCAALPASVFDLVLLVNARIALPPGELEARLRAAIQHAALSASVEWEEFACFQPSRPRAAASLRVSLPDE